MLYKLISVEVLWKEMRTLHKEESEVNGLSDDWERKLPSNYLFYNSVSVISTIIVEMIEFVGRFFHKMRTCLREM